MSGANHSIIRNLPGPLGYSAAFESVGTSAAPLLAGFAFTLIALVVTNSGELAQANVALLLLVMAALLLIHTVQLAVRARTYYVPPGDVLSLMALSEKEGVDPDRIRIECAGWLTQHKRSLDHARAAYNAGIVLLLAGVAVVLIPPGALSHVAALRIAAAGIILLGACLEAAMALKPALRKLFKGAG